MKPLKEAADAGDDSDESEPVVLTASAFQFLLWNRRVQIWHLVLQLLEYSWQVRSSLNKENFLFCSSKN